MKRTLTTTILFILLAAGTVLTVKAFAIDGGFGGPGPGRRGPCALADGQQPGQHYMARLAHVLDLSAEQQAQIQAIVAKARESAAPLREQLDAKRTALHEAVTAKTFDEAKIRALATEKGAIQADLMVHRAQTKQQIYAVLTPEQQQLFDKIQPLLQPRHGRGHWGGHRGPWGPAPAPSDS
jgi:periplasmic protein CpxP/Spy